MTKKKRSVLLSVLTLVLALSLIASGTYALFSDSVKLENHLEAGTLDITLTRTNLLTQSLNTTTGFLVKTENAEDIDFSEPADPNDPNAKNKNVFDITGDTLIVPDCWYTAEMQIKNNSDVAFGYWLEIVFEDGVDLTLADQIQLTVVTVEGTQSKTLSQSKGEIGAKDDHIGTLAKGAEQLFTVTVAFNNLDESVNNTAMSKAMDFDIIVHAVQVTKAPTETPAPAPDPTPAG